MKKGLNSLLLGLLGGIISSIIILLPALYLFQGHTQSHNSLPDISPTSQLVKTGNTGEYSLSKLNEDFVAASFSSKNSVVYVKTTMQNARSYSWRDVIMDGYGSRESVSSGSGVIFSKEGYIITNNHVISNADKIEVIYKGVPFDAKVIGRDPSTDLAVLKIEGEGLEPIVLGSSAKLHVGEWVLAVGNPFNLTSTVTSGIVSAKGRDLNIVKDNFSLESFIQTDAAINPGNSGGALVNIRGELVGINTALLSKTGSYAGYGFAVPVDIVKKVVEDIIKYGRVQKAMFGADLSTLDYRTSKKMGVEFANGVLIERVISGGSAHGAGLKSGDIITEINNYPLTTKASLDEALSLHYPGDKVNMKILREGNSFIEDVLLKNEEGTTEVLYKRSKMSSELGAEFEDLSRVDLEYYKVGHGVKVKNIQKGLIREIGMEEGYIILYIDGKKMDSADEAIDYLKMIRGRTVIEGVNPRGSRGYYSFYY